MGLLFFAVNRVFGARPEAESTNTLRTRTRLTAKNSNPILDSLDTVQTLSSIQRQRQRQILYRTTTHHTVYRKMNDSSMKSSAPTTPKTTTGRGTRTATRTKPSSSAAAASSLSLSSSVLSFLFLIVTMLMMMTLAEGR